MFRFKKWSFMFCFFAHEGLCIDTVVPSYNHLFQCLYLYIFGSFAWMCVWSLSVCQMLLEAWRPGDSVKSLGTAVKNCCELSGRHREWNPGHLEEHPVFLTTEPYFQPSQFIFKGKRNRLTIATILTYFNNFPFCLLINNSSVNAYSIFFSNWWKLQRTFLYKCFYVVERIS